ncbi:MAG: cytochrome b, partial [Gemmatimonadales bacterium]
VKDIVATVVFLFVFFLIVFYLPEMGGYFLEHANFVPANPIVTPEHIAPVWYFTPFYSILRAIPPLFGSQFPGVLVMGLSILVLFFLPWIDRNPIKSIRYRSPVHAINLTVFPIAFVVLGWLGTQPANAPLLAELAVRFTEIYFLFFFVLWAHSRDRSLVFGVVSFLVLLGAITLYDLTRLGGDNVPLVLGGWLIPAAYLTVVLLLPVFTSLSREKPVPARAGAA